MSTKVTWKNFGIMLSGNFGAQIISFLFYPILVRFFSPEDFGVFGTFSSFMVVAGIFASGQLHLAFIKCSDDKEIEELYYLFRLYTFFGTCIVTSLIFVINIKLKYFPNSYILLFFPSILTYLGLEGQKMLAVRAEQFKAMSKTVSMNRFLSNFLKMILGKFQNTPVALIFSEIISNTLASISLKKRFPVEARKPKNTLLLLKKYKHFPLFGTFSNLFQLGLIEFPIIFLASFYSPIEIGKYALALRVLLQPLVVIGNSLGSVVSKRIVNSQLEKTSNRLLLAKIYGTYLGLGSLVFLTMLLIPANVFTLALGGKWVGIKDVILPLSLLSAAKLSSGLHIYFYVAIDGMKMKSIWKAFQLSTLITSIFIFSDLSFTNMLWIICAVEAIIDLIFIIYTILFKSN